MQNTITFCGDPKISVRFGGRIRKFAKLDRSVAAFNTALSGFRFRIFGPNVISYYGKPNHFALIRFHARRLDHLARLLIPHTLEPRVSHPKESE